MKAVIFERCGNPEEVLQVREAPAPKPGRGQVRVRMIASPVNPSDLLYVQGQYGKPPPLPATPGFEGVGVVEESGGGFLARRVMGRRVAVLNAATGNWQEQVVIPARQAVPVPAALSDEQAATFFVNPASALVMVHYVLGVKRGTWLLQTAAGSALGRMVIRLGRLNGFKTINIVRRREQAEELKQAGADAVICSSEESIAEKVKAVTNGQGVPYAIDAVGGTVGTEAVTCLGRNGRLLVYGTLSGEPLSLHPRVLLVGQKRVEGFWLSEWVAQQGPLRMLLLFRRVGRLLREGVLDTTVGETFPLDKVADAVRTAAQPGRQGKVLLRISHSGSAAKA